MRLQGYLIGLSLLLFVTGCSSLTTRDSSARGLFFAGRFQEAANLIPPYREYKGRDKIVFLVDRGVILHTAGKYKESIPYLLEAGEIIKYYDIIRWGEEGGKIITNENFSDYRGEDYERVLIHTYLALNYLMLNMLDDALVECKKIDITLYRIAEKRGTEYKQNPFSLLLSALIYEAMGELNEAYIDYKKLYKLKPNLMLGQDGLLYCSKVLGFADDYDYWKKTFGRDIEIPDRTKYGELIVIYQSGLIPRKIPHPDLKIIPKYQPMFYRSRRAVVSVKSSGDTSKKQDVDAVLVGDIAGAVTRDLEERSLPLLAKRAVILAAKEAIAYKIKREYGDFWGWLAGIVLFMTEQPDLRGIYTLPAEIHLARVYLKEGRYDIYIRCADKSGAKTSDMYEYRDIVITPSKKSLISIRSVN